METRDIRILRCRPSDTTPRSSLRKPPLPVSTLTLEGQPDLNPDAPFPLNELEVVLPGSGDSSQGCERPGDSGGEWTEAGWRRSRVACIQRLNIPRRHRRSYSPSSAEEQTEGSGSVEEEASGCSTVISRLCSRVTARVTSSADDAEAKDCGKGCSCYDTQNPPGMKKILPACLVPAVVLILFILGLSLALRTDGPTTQDFQPVARASRDQEALLRAWEMIVQGNITEDDIREFVFKLREDSRHSSASPQPQAQQEVSHIVPTLANQPNVSRRPVPAAASALHGEKLTASIEDYPNFELLEASKQDSTSVAAVDLESLTADDLDFELGMREAVLANDRSRHGEIALKNFFEEEKESKQEVEQPIRPNRFVTAGNFFVDNRFNKYADAAINNFVIANLEHDNDPLVFKIYPKNEVEPESIYDFVGSRSSKRLLTPLTRRRMDLDATDGRMVVIKKSRQTPFLSMQNFLLNRPVASNFVNRRRAVGGGVITGLSNITRTQDAEVQVVGPTSTMVRIENALGPILMEINVFSLHRLGVTAAVANMFRMGRRNIRRSNRQSRQASNRQIRAEIDQMFTRITTMIDSRGSTLADFEMIPIDLDRVVLTMPAVRPSTLDAITTMSRQVVQRIFSTQGFLADRLRKYAEEAVTSRFP